MKKKRIIPCLDVKEGRTVKGVHFLGLKDAGDPVELAKKYSDQGADELVFLDITATVEGRTATWEMVEKTAARVDIPFTMGGGISTRSEEHTSELQSRGHIVCRLLLEKKKKL